MNVHIGRVVIRVETEAEVRAVCAWFAAMQKAA